MTLSVIIPTLNAGRFLPLAMAALDPADETIVTDGGSTDASVAIAAAWGARVIATEAGRGNQLAAGAAAARGRWLLFLHADTILANGWHAEAEKFMTAPENIRRAAVFRFALDDDAPAARRLEQFVSWRVRMMGLPYGDQGLLLCRDFYQELGGFRPLPLMEDVDLVRRIGRRRLRMLHAAARTSAERWHRDGWLRRSARNLACLALYRLGLPPRLLSRLYG